MMRRPILQTTMHQGGFTLVEVLVAVLVFGLLAAIAYGGLNTLTQASGVHQTRAADFAELQRVVAALDRDLRQLASRPVRQADNAIAPSLAGETNRFNATRAGWINPGRLRRSQLQRFAWQLQDDQLIRRYWPVTDIASGSIALISLQIDQVQALNLRYRDELGRWHTRWPAGGRSDGQTNRLPSAIEYRLQSESFGEIRRLLVL